MLYEIETWIQHNSHKCLIKFISRNSRSQIYLVYAYVLIINDKVYVLKILKKNKATEKVSVKL